MVQKDYSVDFFNSAVENLQRACQTLISFNHVVELSGYLALEIDNVKKERFVLSEFVQSSGNVISESFCTKAWRTGVSVQRQNQSRGGNIAPRPTSSVYGNTLHPCNNESGIPQSVQQNRTGCTQIRKNPVKQEPSSNPGNNTTSSTFVSSQHGQGKQVFNCNPPVQNPIKKLPQRLQGGPYGQKDNTPHLQNIQSSMKHNHQVDHGRIVVKTETDFRMGPNQTGSSRSGVSRNLFAQGKMHMAQGPIGRGHPLQGSDGSRTSLGTTGKGSSSKSMKMMPPMQPPPTSLKCENLLRRQFCNPRGPGGAPRITQKAPGQETLPLKAGPKLIVITSSETQPVKQHMASMPQETRKENVPRDKVATSKAETEVSSVLVHREHGNITIVPEKVQVSKPESSSFTTADVCPVLSKMSTMPKWPTTQSDDKVMPRLEQMDPPLPPLSPIVVINSLSSSLYKQPRVTLKSTDSLTNVLSATVPVLSTADIDWEVPSSTSAKTCAERDSDKTLHRVLPASVVNPSPVTTTTSSPQPNVVEMKPVSSGQGDQGLSNCSGFKVTLEELCLGPPAKHPKLTGKKIKGKAGKKKKRSRKSSQPRNADHGDVEIEDEEMSPRVLIGPTNRTLRSAANPVRRNYAEEQEYENDAANTDTIHDTNTDTNDDAINYTNTDTNDDAINYTNTDTNTEHV